MKSKNNDKKYMFLNNANQKLLDSSFKKYL